MNNTYVVKLPKNTNIKLYNNENPQIFVHLKICNLKKVAEYVYVQVISNILELQGAHLQVQTYNVHNNTCTAIDFMLNGRCVNTYGAV